MIRIVLKLERLRDDRTNLDRDCDGCLPLSGGAADGGGDLALPPESSVAL